MHYVNIRSINANIEELDLLIGKLKSMPTIIICSETWHLPCPILNGYQMYYNNSKIKRADGSVIFIKSNLEHLTMIEEIVINPNSLNKTSVNFLSILLKLNNRKFKIISTYRCHDIKKEDYIKSLEKFLINNKNNKNHIIVGDFIIDF